LIDKFNHSEQLGHTAVITPEILCKGNVTVISILGEGMKILGVNVFKDCVQLSKNQNNVIEKYTHINVNQFDLNDLLLQWKYHVQGIKHLSRAARNVL
jgi:hypothetical protein